MKKLLGLLIILTTFTFADDLTKYEEYTKHDEYQKVRKMLPPEEQEILDEIFALNNLYVDRIEYQIYNTSDEQELYRLKKEREKLLEENDKELERVKRHLILYKK